MESHITYEVGSNERIHPDPQVAARFVEKGLSDCEFGCKLYQDPKSTVVILAHNSTYGCKK